MSVCDVKKACLAVGVVATWSSAQAGEVLPAQGVVNNATTQGPMHFMYTLGGSGPYSGDVMVRDTTGLSFFPGNGLEKPFTASIDYTPELWGTLGCISVDRVSVGVRPDLAPSLLGRTWSDVFPTYSESAIVTAILASDYATLGSFCDEYRSLFSTPYGLGATASLVDFSDGTAGGYVKLVPEPATMATMGLGLLALRRRKRA